MPSSPFFLSFSRHADLEPAAAVSGYYGFKGKLVFGADLGGLRIVCDGNE
jgi:hypothetical protein